MGRRTSPVSGLGRGIGGDEGRRKVGLGGDDGWGYSWATK